MPAVVTNGLDRAPLEVGELGIWVERFAVMPDGTITVAFFQWPGSRSCRLLTVTIELTQDSGVPDGQEVEVIPRIVRPAPDPQGWGEGIIRSAGPLPDDSPDDARILAQVHQSRRRTKLREVQE